MAKKFKLFPIPIRSQTNFVVFFKPFQIDIFFKFWKIADILIFNTTQIQTVLDYL